MNSLSEAIASSGFKPIDFIILVCYLILLVSLGLFLSRSKDGKEKSANDYFLAGNTLTWWAVCQEQGSAMVLLLLHMK